MKRFLFVALLVLLVSTPAFAMKNEPDGFRDIKWHADKFLFEHRFIAGSARPDALGMAYQMTENYYKKAEDFGGAGTYLVQYVFDENGFSAARIAFSGEDNILKAFRSCVAKWGDPDEIKSRAGLTSFYWYGEKCMATFAQLRTIILLSISRNDAIRH